MKTLSISLLVLGLFAQGSALGQSASIRDYYDEPGIDPFNNFDTEGFFEEVDPYTGMLRLGITDVMIPGNGGMDLEIRRSYTTPSFSWDERSAYGYGWTMHFGRIVVDTQHSDKICNQGLWATSVIDNPSLELSDGSRHLLVLADNHGADLITRSWWSAECSGGEIEVTSPDGTVYEMDYLSVAGDVTSLYATRIEDRNGNTISIDYGTNSSGITYIDDVSTSDGRSVNFSYANQSSSGIRLSSISSNGHTWDYDYSYPSGLQDPPAQLEAINRPDGTSWDFDYYPLNSTGDAGGLAISELVTPSGGEIDYEYEFVFFDGGNDPTQSTVVSERTKSGTGASTGTWHYDYDPGFLSGSGFDETTVTQPDGTRQYRHIGYSSVGSGDVWRIGLRYYELFFDNNGNIKEQIAYDYARLEISDENFWHGRDTTKIDNATYAPVISEVFHWRENNATTTTYSNFTSYGQPQAVTETTNLTGDPGKTRTYTYSNNSSRWILGLVTNETLTHSNGAPVTSWDTTRTFDTNGNLLTEDRDGVVTSYTYTSEGDVATITDANSNTITLSDYFRGTPRAESHPEGVTISRTVNPDGTIDTETNGRGHTTSYTWDGLNRLTGVDYPLHADTSISYTQNARTTARGDFEEVVTWDGFGRMLDTTHTDTNLQESIQVTQTRDSMGRVTFRSYPNSTSGVTTTYDIFGRPLSETHSNGNQTLYSYPTGSQVVATDENGNVTEALYGYYGTMDLGSGVLLNIYSPESIRTILSRNGKGQIWRVFQGEEDAQGQILGYARVYTHNASGFLMSEQNPEIGITNYTYDAVGNMLTESVSGSGITETRTYDDRNRLSTISYSDSTPGVSFAYDKDDNLTGVDNSVAVRGYVYDANGNMTSESLSVGGNSYNIGYALDGIDHVDDVTYPSGRTVSFNPDAFGRPRSASPYVTQIDYHPNDVLASMSFANGTSATMGIDARQRPDSVAVSGTSGSFIDLAYQYDNSFNVEQITDSVGNLHDVSLQYDQVDRMVSATGVWGTESIIYDFAGNIRGRDRNGSLQQYYYNNLKLAYRQFPSYFQVHDYDLHGNTIDDGFNQYTYNAANRLTQAITASSTIDYLYDGSGNRVSRDTGASETHYIYSANGELLGEYDVAGGFEEFVYIQSNPVTRISDDTTAVGNQ